MKYTPTERRPGESLSAYAERLDQERLIHVADKLGLGDLAGQPPRRVLGKILDVLSEEAVNSTMKGERA